MPDLELPPRRETVARERAPAQGLWPRAVGAQAVVLFVYPCRAECMQPGQRFIAEVLAANGLATLSVALSSPDGPSCGQALPDAGQTADFLQQVVDALESDAVLRGLPLALVGVHEAAAVCAAALAHARLTAVKSCVWLDGPVDHQEASVAAWSRPTLCLTGRHGIGGVPQPWRGVRRLPAPHRLVKLQQRSRPEPSAGVHEAMACELLAWLERTLSAAAVAGAPIASASA